MHPQDTPIKIPLRARDGSIRAYVVVDPEDAHLGEQHRWYLEHTGYAKRNIHTARVDGKRTSYSLYLHRVILGLERGDPRFADHRNRDKLDCRRVNLRIVTAAQNTQNQPPQARGVSRFRGVTFYRRTGQWQVRATINGRVHSLGYFDDELEAARVARDFRKEHMPYATD